MIRMSRARRRDLGTRAGSRLWPLIGLAWHVGCIPMLAGCPYLLPGWSPVNRAPRIVQPDPTEDLVLVMDNELNQVIVFARDDDGDALTFLWVPPPDAEYEIDDGNQRGLAWSSLSLVRDPDLDGEELLVAVDDGQSEAFASWTIQLPGAK